MPADVAAESTAAAFAAHEKAHSSVGPFARVLHIGCGTSHLGRHLISALSSHMRVSARVMNVDYSMEAVAIMKAHRDDEEQQQLFRVWDASSGTVPPTLPNTMYSCGASTRYDLLVDKGTLDVLCFSREDALVAYFEALRGCLLEVSLETAMPPLLVHLTDEPPDARGELLAAAFPSGDEHRWRHECVELRAGDAERDRESRSGEVVAGGASRERACYRYTVWRA